MEAIITFAKDASPVMLALVVIGGLVHVVIMLLKNTGILKNVRSTQVSRTVNEVLALSDIGEKLDKIAGNHLHGLPDMEKSLERIEQKQDKMIEVLYDIRNNTNSSRR